MFTNAARQKFPEASLILLCATVCAVVRAARLPAPQAAGEDCVAPLACAIDGFQLAWPTVSAVMAGAMILYTGLSLGRAALRRYLYPAHTLVGIPLAGIMICGFSLPAQYLSAAVLILLTGIALKRLYGCFNADDPVPQLFPAMICLGCTPLLYTPMTALVVSLLPVMWLCRLSLRSQTAAAVGALLPAFTVCYVRWTAGEAFGTTAYDIWRDMLSPAAFDLAAYVTTARLALLGMTLFTLICSMMLYRSDRFAVGVAARKIWRFTVWIIVLTSALFAALPSSTQLSAIVVSLMASTLMPMFFVRMENYISSSLYWLMAGAAIWTLFC